jgi:hypothetical protein
MTEQNPVMEFKNLNDIIDLFSSTNNLEESKETQIFLESVSLFKNNIQRSFSSLNSQLSLKGNSIEFKIIDDAFGQEMNFSTNDKTYTLIYLGSKGKEINALSDPFIRIEFVVHKKDVDFSWSNFFKGLTPLEIVKMNPGAADEFKKRLDEALNKTLLEFLKNNYPLQNNESATANPKPAV